jgi:hypothetical protein
VLVLSREEPIRKRQVIECRHESRMCPVLVLSREELIRKLKLQTAAVNAEGFQCSL